MRLAICVLLITFVAENNNNSIIMKKTQILLSLVAACATTAFADDYKYPYLIVTASDGTETTLNAAALEITFADGKLVATNDDGTTQLMLADLASMRFSETEGVQPEVDNVKSLNAATEVKVFTTSGIYVGTFESVAKAKASLKKGLYVITLNNKSQKLNIR